MGRYDRQLLEFTEEEQKALRSATVGMIGCGGLGNGVSTSLAVAGVGKLIIMDPDVPEESNLNRQFVFCKNVLSEAERRPKAELLFEWIADLNKDVEVEYHVGRFSEETSHIFDECDVIVDCLDSLKDRMLVNSYCVKTGKPFVHGAIDGFIAEIAVIRPGVTPCLRCMMGDCNYGGRTPASIGSVVMSTASMEATEVLKLLIGRSGRTEGLFISFDYLNWNHTKINFSKDPDCPVCGVGKQKE